MDRWAAWEGARTLSFLHARARQLMRGQGAEDLDLDVDGHRVHYYAGGPRDAARTVVLLHGLGDSAHNWWRTLPLLAWRGDRVLAPDLPGHGYSRPHDARGFLTVREQAEVVRRLVEHERPQGEVALVGHSLGGWVATRAHLAGLDASRLVLVESAGLEYEGMWDSIEMLRIEHEEDVKRFFRTICHKPPAALSLLSREVAAMFKTPAVLNFIAASHGDDLIRDRELARVRAATTILWGDADGLIPPILAHRWHAGIPRSDLVWIEKCGHAPQFERPLLFQTLLETALGHPTLTAHLRSRLAAHVPPIFRRRAGEA